VGGEKARARGVRIGWLVVGTLLCGAGGAAWQARSPARYRAVCLLDYGQDPLAAAGSAGPRGPGSDEWYRTQDIVLASRVLAERVVEELRLERDRSFAGPDAPRDPAAARTSAARKLQERLNITPVPATHAVQVAFDDTQPERAARIANAVVDAYLKKALEDRVAASQRALAWLNEQIVGTGRRLAETEFEIQTYLERQEGPAVAPEERLAMVTEEIKRLTQALTDTRLSRIELSARLTKLKGTVETGNPFDARTQEIDGSDDVKQLRAAYIALLLDRAPPAAETAADKAPQPLGQKKLDALWGRMQSTLAGIVRNAQAELAAVQQVETQLQNALERANTTGHAIQRQQLEYVRLSRERNEAEHWLTALRERSSAAGVAAAAGTLGARVIDPATAPLEPLMPRFLVGGALGALLGLALASLTLLLASRVRPLRAHPPRDAQDATKQAAE
jgi:polysaccharide biosynthesis transport protein